MNKDTNKIIYSMVRVGKQHNKKPVLQDISLSFFLGAKIGVLGLNGAGKSTLLKIMAGIDSDFQGETVLAPGITVGFLEQEPLRDEERTVMEVVRDGVRQLVLPPEAPPPVGWRESYPVERCERRDLACAPATAGWMVRAR